METQDTGKTYRETELSGEQQYIPMSQEWNEIDAFTAGLESDVGPVDNMAEWKLPLCDMKKMVKMKTESKISIPKRDNEGELQKSTEGVETHLNSAMHRHRFSHESGTGDRGKSHFQNQLDSPCFVSLVVIFK